MEKQKVRMINTNPKSRFYNKVRFFSQASAKSGWAKNEGWIRQELPEAAPAAVRESVSRIPEQTENKKPWTPEKMQELADATGGKLNELSPEQRQHSGGITHIISYPETPETFDGDTIAKEGIGTGEPMEGVEAQPDGVYTELNTVPIPTPKRRGRKPNPDKAVTKSKKK